MYTSMYSSNVDLYCNLYCKFVVSGQLHILWGVYNYFFLFFHFQCFCTHLINYSSNVNVDLYCKFVVSGQPDKQIASLVIIKTHRGGGGGKSQNSNTLSEHARCLLNQCDFWHDYSLLS